MIIGPLSKTPSIARYMPSSYQSTVDGWYFTMPSWIYELTHSTVCRSSLDLLRIGMQSLHVEKDDVTMRRRCGCRSVEDVSRHWLIPSLPYTECLAFLSRQNLCLHQEFSPSQTLPNGTERISSRIPSSVSRAFAGLSIPSTPAFTRT